MKQASCLWLLMLLPITGFADEVEKFLTRIRQNGSVAFNYEETRNLELVSKPWQGQGQMLSSVDGSLVKLQLQPKRVIMISTKDRMVYFDPEQGQHHSVSVSDAGQAGASLTLFRSMLQGHSPDLQSDFNFATEQHGKHWILKISPKQKPGNEQTPSLEFSGTENDNTRQVVIREKDGESTEYRLVKTSEGAEVEKSIQRLLLEATGD